jgi:hypothetical protein
MDLLDVAGALAADFAKAHPFLSLAMLGGLAVALLDPWMKLADKWEAEADRAKAQAERARRR